MGNRRHRDTEMLWFIRMIVVIRYGQKSSESRELYTDH